jgi:AcrR family transcriptional regulator
MADENTRDRIFTAAIELLREGGVEAGSARSICDRAGITAPTLYHHFCDLKQLHQLVVEHAFAESLRRKMLPQQADDAISKIAYGWDAYVTFAMEEPCLFAIVNRQITSGTLPAIALQSYEKLVENVRALERECGLRFDIEVSAQMLWAAAHGTACLVAALKGEFSPDVSLSERLRDTTIAGIVSSCKITS